MGGRRVASELDAVITAIHEARDREHLAPAIAAFEALLERSPDDPRLVHADDPPGDLGRHAAAATGNADHLLERDRGSQS